MRDDHVVPDEMYFPDYGWQDDNGKVHSSLLFLFLDNVSIHNVSIYSSQISVLVPHSL